MTPRRPLETLGRGGGGARGCGSRRGIRGPTNVGPAFASGEICASMICWSYDFGDAINNLGCEIGDSTAAFIESIDY